MSGEYTINNIYEGTPSSLDPAYGDIFTGYRVPASQLGAPTKADDVNQLSQVNMLLNQGIVPIEVGVMDAKVFDSIPAEMFKEINRKAKLAGAKISVHAPIVEASGISQQGYEESTRKLAENQLVDVVDRTASMNEKGGMSITVHSTANLPGLGYEMTPKGKKVTSLVVVNKETGKPTTLLKEEIKAYPYLIGTTGKMKVRSIASQLQDLNSSEWDNTLSQLTHHIEDADARIKESSQILIPEILQKVINKEISPRILKPIEVNAYHRLQAGEQFLSDASKEANVMFDKAWKQANEEDKKKLKNISKNYAEQLGMAHAIGQKSHADGVAHESNALHELVNTMKEIVPEIYQPIEEYAIDKSAKTFANVALHGLLKYKDKAPVINIENFMGAESAFSMGKELDALIMETKKQFVAAALEKGISESRAEQKADELIGVTLDVGHLNVAKKHGFKDKDLLKEIEPIAKHVKHVHLTDNFGREDSHLVPGQGNVPMKEILEKLGEAGYKGTKIVEAAPGGVQLLGAKTFSKVLEAMGSPVFANSIGSPYWNQSAGLQQSYSGGFGNMLPQVNYETFGAGFSNVPMELGGTRPTARGSRLSGDPLD